MRGSPIPATFLVARVNCIVLLIPWFLLWAFVFALTPVCWLIGLATRASAPQSKGRFFLYWHLLVSVLVMMRGTTISVRHNRQRLYLKWI